MDLPNKKIIKSPIPVKYKKSDDSSESTPKTIILNKTPNEKTKAVRFAQLPVTTPKNKNKKIVVRRKPKKYVYILLISFCSLVFLLFMYNK